ncbi:hypothetical protein SDRG_07354 [Saprolegnia diclina VS20]|uniref:Uncharacterized protein n=1 Tax=Saprolegnia diclina (strain VS20) TaxID=1156394 RepID=T0QMR5_SAPDV|nr:hypothetical protein SDRG_07354 [Saprolegnia diclina VS20]EQC35120.1 hypothetical protein SDRG_07354 [Saprolegnia diclina VS20]|eukprot:XP_008611404.1 hypothetical protein SDRG_07354 [Saprolegnia diclina VS20]
MEKDLLQSTSRPHARVQHMSTMAETPPPSLRTVAPDPGMSTTTVVIIIVAAIVGLLLVVALGIYILRRRRRSQQEAFSHPPTLPTTMPPPAVHAPPTMVPMAAPTHPVAATSEGNAHFAPATTTVQHGTSPGLPSNFYDRGNSYNDADARDHLHHTRFTDLSTNSYGTENVSFSGSIMSDSSGSFSSRPYDSLGENDVAWKYMTDSEKLRYMQSKESPGANSLHDSESFESFHVGPSRRL